MSRVSTKEWWCFHRMAVLCLWRTSSQPLREESTEVTDLHVHQMSEYITFLSVSRVRYKTEGQALERRGQTSAFRKTADG